MAGLCGLTGAGAALGGSDVRLVSAGGCAGPEAVSRRCVVIRSSNDRRDPLLSWETLGEEACGVGFVTLSVPTRLPVPLDLGGSTGRGCDNILEVSTRGLEDGGVLGAGALIDGREGLEGMLGADGLGVEGLDLLSTRSNSDPRLGVPDIEGALGRGAGWAPTDGLGRLTGGGLLRKTGDGGLLLGICGLGEDRNDRDGLGLDIRPNDEPPPELPRLEKDGEGAAGRLGDGAAARGAAIREPWSPRDENLAWTDEPPSSTSPAMTFTMAARELLSLPRAADIFASPSISRRARQNHTGTLHDHTNRALTHCEDRPQTRF